MRLYIYIYIYMRLATCIYIANLIISDAISICFILALLMITHFDIIFVCVWFPAFTLYLLLQVSFPIWELFFSKWDLFFPPYLGKFGFPGGSDGKESIYNVGDLGLIPGLGRSPGGGNDNPLQYSWFENPHGQIIHYQCPFPHSELQSTTATQETLQYFLVGLAQVP